MKTTDRLMSEATLFLDEANAILNNLRQAVVDADNEGASDEEKMLAIQLTLQYRLSCEDALGLLLRLDHNLLYALGVQPQQSDAMNRDRLAYAVGNEDLKQILTVLAILTGSLSKMLARYKSTHASFSLKDKRPQQRHVITNELSMLLAKQTQFLAVLHKLDPEIALLIKQQASPSIVNSIATLRRPILHFHQRILDNLKQAKQLYLQVNKTPVMDHQLNTLLKKTEQVLHLMPSTYNPHVHYPIKQFDHPTTSERLEQRAAAKRLRPFFG